MCDLYTKIEKLCKKRKIKISDLSRKTGITKTCFSDLKNNRSKSISIDKLIIIADYFDVSLDDLVGRKKASTAETAEAEKIMELIREMTSEQQALFCSLAEQLILRNSRG